MKNYLCDTDQVRYELYQTNAGKNYNWLFFPGGPGADSSYLRSLVDELKLPGNVWLIDLPGNGSNASDSYSDNFDSWFELFPRIVKQFDNPIVVGHSFGGMLPLLYPDLETILAGCIILNSAPVLWQEEAVAYSKQFDLPDLTSDMHAFIQTPNQETFDGALNACMPYYFPKETLEKGRKLLSQLPFSYRAAVWGQVKALEGKLLAQWIPQQVPTLIIGSKYDCICPFSLFTKDERFRRKNIRLLFIEDAGHCPWVENPIAVRKAFEELCLQLKDTK
ncbi:MAG: alpha/beta hydrolase [Rhabdochlamydiaceae bacterium]|nr:alpha/beta hydrolase [Rhabdochlamydiaceae bacterium]